MVYVDGQRSEPVKVRTCRTKTITVDDAEVPRAPVCAHATLVFVGGICGRISERIGTLCEGGGCSQKVPSVVS